MAFLFSGAAFSFPAATRYTPAMMNQVAIPARRNASSPRGNASRAPIVAGLLFTRNLAWLS